jgi:hypothetical protein
MGNLAGREELQIFMQTLSHCKKVVKPRGPFLVGTPENNLPGLLFRKNAGKKTIKNRDLGGSRFLAILKKIYKEKQMRS